jgi:hypothetical protein
MPASAMDHLIVSTIVDPEKNIIFVNQFPKLTKSEVLPLKDRRQSPKYRPAIHWHRPVGRLGNTYHRIKSVK